MFSMHLMFGFDENSIEAFSYECKVISRFSVFSIASEIILEAPDILTIDQAFAFFGMFFIDKEKRRTRINQ